MENTSTTMDIYCENCNVLIAATTLFTHTHSTPENGGISLDLSDTPHNTWLYSLLECPRCNGIFLKEANYYEVPGEFSAPQGETILYPTTRNIIDTAILPPLVSKPYITALSSFKAGLYEPCVIMCRKSLEALCKEKGVVTRNLKTSIDQLLKDKQIDEKLYIWANGLRLIGNDAAHDVSIEITKEDSADSIEFLEALLLYIFVLDTKFMRFQSRRNK